MNETMRPQRAPREANPELQGFLAQIVPGLGDTRRDETFQSYLDGLLTDHPNKNCDTLAQIVPETSEQRLQGLLTTMRWDETEVNRRRVKVMTELKSEGDGVLIFDGTDFPKKGKHSVGVTRQYSGSLGKDRQLSGDGELSLCRTNDCLAGRNAAVSAQRMDTGSGTV